MSTTALPSQSSDFPAWYGDVVRRAGLAENSAVRGAMVIKPYGYAIWETIQQELDARIKATGHENLYLPLFVPASVLAQEGALVEGFAPEVAVVTEAGGKKLDEPLAVRPTSEALIWSTYAPSCTTPRLTSTGPKLRATVRTCAEPASSTGLMPGATRQTAGSWTTNIRTLPTTDPQARRTASLDNSVWPPNSTSVTIIATFQTTGAA